MFALACSFRKVSGLPDDDDGDDGDDDAGDDDEDVFCSFLSHTQYIDA